MTSIRLLVFYICLLLITSHAQATEECFILYDLAEECELLRIDRSEISGVRFNPCSTFKIANALIALDLEVIEEDTELSWDGTELPFAMWERNHTLASAIRYSVVWYFQEVARRVGEANYCHYLSLMDYGNGDPSSGLDAFWLGEGSLTISPDEQLHFLNRLYNDDLLVSLASMDAVKRMLVRDSGDGWTLSGKTGACGSLSWFVGHVGTSGKEYTFVALVRGEEASGNRPAVRLTEQILFGLGLKEARP